MRLYIELSEAEREHAARLLGRPVEDRLAFEISDEHGIGILNHVLLHQYEPLPSQLTGDKGAAATKR